MSSCRRVLFWMRGTMQRRLGSPRRGDFLRGGGMDLGVGAECMRVCRQIENAVQGERGEEEWDVSRGYDEV